jgi:hypothetical protein
MEGTPLSSTSDPESGLDTKKSKEKQKRFELEPENSTTMSLRQSRHIAREALRHEEKDTSELAEKNADVTAYKTFEHRQPAPEAKQLHGGGSEPEHIGHVLITAEAAKRHKAESTSLAKQETRQLPPNKRIETLSRPELLSLSEQINVEGTSLRHVYETHLIGEQALRRLVAEYLLGGNIQQSLQREIVEHEIDFERDPALRDIALPADTNKSDITHLNAPGKEALHQLLKEAEAGIDTNEEELTYDRTEPNPLDNHQVKKAIQPSPPGQQRPVDILMGVTIVVLLILVIVLYFWHR